MSVLSVYRRGVQEHGVGAIPTLTRYYVARVAGMLTGPGRVCPVCDTQVREFLPFMELRYGSVRNRAACPGCGALERHRAYARFYRTFIPENFELPIDILHASSEEALVRVLGRFARRYDLSDYESPPPGHIQVDICDPKLPPKSYDLIVLNHVLMCVPGDRRAVEALGELLRPGGMIIAGERILSGESTRSQAVAGYGGRFNQYGDADVARHFAPFEVTVVDVAKELTPDERQRYGIADRETLMLIRNPGDRPRRTGGAAR